MKWKRGVPLPPLPPLALALPLPTNGAGWSSEPPQLLEQLRQRLRP